MTRAFRHKIKDLSQQRNLSSSKYKDAVGGREKGLDLGRSRFPDFELRVKVKLRARANRNDKRNLELLQRRQILFQNLSVDKIILALNKEQWSLIEQYNRQGVISSGESKCNAESLNCSVSLPRILMNDHRDTGRHDTSAERRSVEGNKTIASIDHVRENDQTTERDLFLETIGRNAMLLAPISTNEQLGANFREL